MHCHSYAPVHHVCIELSAAISTVRAQYLNGHIPSRKFGIDQHDSDSLRQLQQLQHALEVSEGDRRDEREVFRKTIAMLETQISVMKANILENSLKLQENNAAHNRHIGELKQMLRTHGAFNHDIVNTEELHQFIPLVEKEVKPATPRPMTAVVLPEYKEVQAPTIALQEDRYSMSL